MNRFATTVFFFGAALVTRAAAAQTASPVCVPGTQFCASSDGRGGVQINANGAGQVGPNGANATGQANAQGNANANANANARGNAGGYAGGDGNVSGGSSHRHRHYAGRFGVGAIPCVVARAGVWSGYKFGGCFAVSFRWESLTFEMETQLVYGGTTHAFDWTFPMSFVIPLANDRSLFEGPYLRFGGSPIGVTFARKRDGGDFARFGLFAGAGYELAIGDSVSWRVIDARLSFDMGTKRAMDRVGHWVDLGAQIGTGLIL